MIHPSYVDLMNVVNKGVEEGETPIINSRYSIVMACAKRARQLVDGDEPLIDNTEGMKPLSIAVKELEQGELKILPQDEDEVEKRELEDVREAKALEETLSGDVSALPQETDDDDVVEKDSTESDAAGETDTDSEEE